jgi:hypothetical protein
MQQGSEEKKRCAQCNKKVGILGIKCRCGKLCCTSHVTAETHSCTFDYKTAGQQQLSTMLVHIGPERMEKI